MADQKLITSIFDLNKNIEKLSGDVKKNTAASDENAAGVKSLAGDLKGLDFKGVSEGLKGLDFKGVTEGLKGLDLKGVASSIKGLDFKSVTEGLKGLDLKGVASSIKGLDFKGVTEGLKGLDISGIGDITKGFNAKDIISGGSVKNALSGGIGKKILGAFKYGGKADNYGDYLVGEDGPELVKLNKGDKVLPNASTVEESIDKLSKNQERDTKSSPDIDAYFESYFAERNKSNYDNYGELEDEYDDSSYETFTKEDIAKLSKPIGKKEEQANELSETLGTPEKLNPNEKEGSSEKKEKKDGLFSRVFGKNKDKENPEEGGKSKFSGLLSKGQDLLKSGSTDLANKASELGLSGISGIKDSLKLGKSGLDPGGIMQSLKGGLADKSNKNGIGDVKNDVLKLGKIGKKDSSSTETDSKTSDTGQGKKVESSQSNKESMNSLPETLGSTDNASNKTEASSGSGASSGLSKEDGDAIKVLLARIASTLEGTLNVSTLEKPFRPNSRKF